MGDLLGQAGQGLSSGEGLAGGIAHAINPTVGKIYDVGNSLAGLALAGSGGGTSLGSSMGLPGVSDSAISDMLGSVNPGSGVGAGIAPSGGGKGGGGLSSLMNSTSGGPSGMDSATKLVSSLGSLFGNKGQGQQQQQPPQPKEINPAKGPGPTPQLPTPPPTAIGGRVGPESIDPRIMAILARLRR